MITCLADYRGYWWMMLQFPSKTFLQAKLFTIRFISWRSVCVLLENISLLSCFHQCTHTWVLLFLFFIPLPIMLSTDLIIVLLAWKCVTFLFIFYKYYELPVDSISSSIFIPAKCILNFCFFTIEMALK